MNLQADCLLPACYFLTKHMDTNIRINKADRDSLATLANLSRKTLKQTLTELANALSANRFGVEQIISLTGSINLAEIIAAGVEVTLTQAQRRHDSLKMIAKEVTTTISAEVRIKNVIKDCNHWLQLAKLAELPAKILPVNSKEIFNRPYFYEKQYLQKATSGKYTLNDNTGEIVLND